MVIQQQIKRFWWRMLAIGVVIDAAIALALASIFAEEGQRLLAVGIIWLALQALSVAMSLRYLLHATAAWKLGQAEIAEDIFFAELQHAELPAPKRFEDSVEGYLDSVVGNSELSGEKRGAAATLLGMRTTLNETLGLVRGMMFKGAHERALKRYSEQKTA